VASLKNSLLHLLDHLFKMNWLFANWLQSKAIAFNKIALQRIFKRRVKMFKSYYRRPLPLLLDIDPEPILRSKQETYWRYHFERSIEMR